MGSLSKRRFAKGVTLEMELGGRMHVVGSDDSR